jgi:IS30 family transposase
MQKEEVIFDYKQLVRDFRFQLGEQIANYALQHKECRVREMAHLFNVTHSTIECAMRRSGLKRKRGRKTYHFPKKERQSGAGA